MIEEVGSYLMLKYTKMKLRAKDNGKKGFDSDLETEGDETALIAGSDYKKHTRKFKSTYYEYGAFCHKSVDCKENIGNSQSNKNSG